MPRVLSGTARGTHLKSPNGILTRPTSDRAKEAIFNIIASGIEGSYFLDLFAGTGQMGIESLSRGGEKAVFIDVSKDSINLITTNLEKTKLTDKALVLKGDYTVALKRILIEKPFDYIYIDPPYTESMKIFKKVVATLIEQKLVKESSVIILEHDFKSIPGDFVMNLKLKRSCKYGSTVISFYERYYN